MSPSEPTEPSETQGLPQRRDPEQPAESTTAQPRRQILKARPQRVLRVIHEAVRQELRFFSGPLPPPEVLIEYNKVYPECGRAIVEMAHREQSHRHGAEDRQLDGDIGLARRGQLIGGLLALIAVGGAIYFLDHDKSVAGLTVLGTVVVAFGSAFVYDRHQRARPPDEPEEEEDEGRKTQELDAIEPPILPTADPS